MQNMIVVSHEGGTLAQNEQITRKN